MIKLKKNMLRKFFSFLCERQNIYWNRTEGKPRPWTSDPILQKYFFCNVYRELDRGTQFYLETVLDPNIPKLASRTRLMSFDIVFRTLVYRLFNEPNTYRYLQKYMVNYNGHKAAELLDRKHEAGIRIFRNAWMTSGANVIGSKARAYCLSLDKIFKKRVSFTDSILKCDTMEGAWKNVISVPWFGGFSAYQVVLDLSYIPRFKLRWTDYDTWVYPGPGAKLGLLWLMGYEPIKRKNSGAKKLLGSDSDDLIKDLCANQNFYFHKFGLEFRRWDDKELDLHNCEFSLCEFNKYMRAHHEGGKKKKFIPKD